MPGTNEATIATLATSQIQTSQQLNLRRQRLELGLSKPI